MVTFMVVNLLPAYNIIHYRPTLNKLRVIIFTYHRVMKFPTRTRIREVISDRCESRRCYLTTVTLLKKSRASHSTPENTKFPPSPFDHPLIDPWEVFEDPHRPEPTKLVLEVPLDKHQPDRVVKIRSMLPEKNQVQLIDFLVRNVLGP
ncbi:hypothetical protein GW17_00012681 [Ensete ventricosum]|nr:hypothetical protein GW17_00012681 [Ensete ventricosum]RZR85400.1 hypothetical protein BHM03_00012369 [Ensete ventricosum]